MDSSLLTSIFMYFLLIDYSHTNLILIQKNNILYVFFTFTWGILGFNASRKDDITRANTHHIVDSNKMRATTSIDLHRIVRRTFCVLLFRSRSFWIISGGISRETPRRSLQRNPSFSLKTSNTRTRSPKRRPKPCGKRRSGE